MQRKGLSPTSDEVRCGCQCQPPYAARIGIAILEKSHSTSTLVCHSSGTSQGSILRSDLQQASTLSLSCSDSPACVDDGSKPRRESRQAACLGEWRQMCGRTCCLLDLQSPQSRVRSLPLPERTHALAPSPSATSLSATVSHRTVSHHSAVSHPARLDYRRSVRQQCWLFWAR